MTGIAAIFAPGPPRQEQLDRMMAAMGERVRDDAGTWARAPFALGAVVLHTTAESLETAQPHVNEDTGLALVMDGYLTNWEELRRDLLDRGAVVRNRSDAELVLRAYEIWGEECAARLEGEFAIIVADQRRRLVYAARDHQGLRPLFVHQDGDALLLASDIGAIIAACERKPEPNLEYLAGIAAGHWFMRDATVWQGVERVPQAHWLAFDGRDRRLRHYYDLPVEETIRHRSEADYVDHYRQVLFDAVRRTSRSHRPLAIAVSGGLDSSAIYCIAHQLEQQGRLPAPGLQGYTLAGEEGTEAFELPYARAAADHCGRSLIEVPLFRPEIDWFTRQVGRNRDIPIPQNGAMSISLEKAAVANGSRAFLNGDGGDQWLDGNLLYYYEFARRFDLPGLIGATARDASIRGWGATLPLAIRSALGAYVPASVRRKVRSRRIEARFADPGHLFWLRREWRERLREIEARHNDTLPAGSAAAGKLNRLYSPYRALALDMMQRQRAQNGVETREPMQTRQFIEFSCMTPEWIRNQGGVRKVVHRKAMAGILPDLIASRTSKADFGAPALTAAFAHYAIAHADGALSRICEPAALPRLFGLDSEIGIDLQVCWEIWGSYAVAAFLAES